jgi:glycosyltransferase involved in cell wall biosynthesis
VCTNRAPEAVAEALSALDANAPGVPRALVTSGLGAEAVKAHRKAAPGWEILAEPRVGLSRARNRALAWAAGDDEVLAFVDDDAVVDPGWLGQLTRRWDEAPEEVAVIGGTIRPRFSVAPPAWISDPILPALTVLMRGPEVRDIDPHFESVFGANVSFRAGPLRAIGGFDPALGHSGGRVFFAEEDEAQRALVRIGHTVRYIPDAGVDHVIPASRLTKSSFIERRYKFGIALGMRGGRAPGFAARQAAVAALGAAVATVRGDEKKQMERAVRAGENAGAVVGALFKRR